MRGLLLAISAITLLVIGGGSLSAQTTGSITGTVLLDDGSTAVNDAVVFVNEYRTGAAAGTTVTDTDGTYTVSGLEGGRYFVFRKRRSPRVSRPVLRWRFGREERHDGPGSGGGHYSGDRLRAGLRRLHLRHGAEGQRRHCGLGGRGLGRTCRRRRRRRTHGLRWHLHHHGLARRRVPRVEASAVPSARGSSASTTTRRRIVPTPTP